MMFSVLGFLQMDFTINVSGHGYNRLPDGIGGCSVV
jgi:hypothetical protein